MHFTTQFSLTTFAPASVIGFDLGRTSNLLERLASATGIINQAGFIASLIVIVLIGAVLDWRGDGGYTPSDFRWAMSVQYVLWALGVVQILRFQRQSRRLALELDPLARTRTAHQPG